MKNILLPASSGLVFECWLKKKSDAICCQRLLSIEANGSTVYKIADAPHYYEHFSYTNYGGYPLLLSLSDEVEMSLAYIYEPDTVHKQGVTYLDEHNGQLSLKGQQDLESWYQAEDFRPQQHFSPFKAWMNDPNGLCKIEDTYHLFYQFHPNGTDWGPMHWGHAISKDLLCWTHLPVFNLPQQNLAALGATGGAFSGTTFIDESGKPSFFYTERLPAYDLYKDYIEIQKKAEFDRNYIKASGVRTIVDQKPDNVGCDIRDPKVWYDNECDVYRMILGSVYDGHPAVLQYTSQDSENWEFYNVLYQAPAYFSENQGRCVECPDFFLLGNKWVLIMGIVGYKEAETNRFNLLYALTGSFDNGEFSPDTNELQVLDFATEYYALQTFNDGQRQIGLAWLFNWAMKKPIESAYNGEMSIPKELTLNSRNRICMQPISELEKYVCSSEIFNVEAQHTQSVKYGKTIRLRLSPDTVQPFSIVLNHDNGHWITFKFDGQKVSIVEDQVCDGRYESNVNHVSDVDLIFDAGILEVFVNGGEICATKRNYRIPICSHLDFHFEENKKITTKLETLRTSWK
ncbi:GH32 C-terminal domain-containing protein [Vibrio viridaestus]|uniref:beta-fructofuranosidase n=1 Tax=Vibrio viridaestus TaxID=2487322 RepID=A0A3N9TDD1_9VIBR|nr:GH32 C-terminal domain-containing protein [Vibrio viridaestus]RQW62059.1 glycoside hydrolase family 32 protein [Vibrio viridaestus]